MDARQLETILDDFARASGIKPVRPYYIWGEFLIKHKSGTLYSDESFEYCEGCADALLTKALPLLPKARREDHRVSPTELHGEDTCKNCMICGALLDYALNDCGVESELDHYQSCSPRAPLHPGDAFHIARMLEAAPQDPAVLRLARDAARLMPAMGPPRAMLSSQTG